MARSPDETRIVEVATTPETIRECSGVGDFLGIEDTFEREVCAAWRKAAVAALEDDPRARLLVIESPRGNRLLHSQWCGAKWGYGYGAIAAMSSDLTEDEKDAVGDAQVAGVKAARALFDKLNAE